MKIPTLQDVLLARRQISPYLSPTPMHSYPAINELIGTKVFIKHENHQPVCAFKVRGGVNLVSQMSDEEKARGVIAASTGNHGQSVAYAARLFDVATRIVVPENANPGKVAAMQGFGAEVIFHGEKFDDARVHCEELVAKHGYRYIHSGDEPLLVAGVATYALEMLETQPDLEIIIVPVGGGSGVAGTCIAAKAINPSIKVIGVQAEAAPAAFESWQQKRIVESPNRTFAEGLATAVGFNFPQQIMQQMLDDFILVSDNEILQAMYWMVERAHTLAEGAGASSLAAAYRMREEFAGKKIGIVCSGGNSSIEHLKQALQQQQQTS
jgi:threonine dehydratase